MMDRAKDRFANDARSHEKAKVRPEHIQAAHQSVGRAPDVDHAFGAARLENPFDALFDRRD